MDYLAPRKVRLKADLTKYDTRCVPGCIGWTTKSREGYASFDHFAYVQFENGAAMPVAFNSFEIVEEKQGSNRCQKQSKSNSRSS